MSIAARPARSWRTTSPLMKMVQKMRIYLTKACRTCPFKDQCTTSNERRIKRWEHEHVVEAAQTRLDQNPQAMRVRRETVEHPFATLKMRMGATHFLMKRLPNVATEMALNVLSYNLTRVMNIVGIKPLLVAIRAVKSSCCYAHRVTVQVAQRGRACARVDSGLDKAKICSDRHVDADSPRWRTDFWGGKRFYTAWTRCGPRRPDQTLDLRMSRKNSLPRKRFDRSLCAAAAWPPKRCVFILCSCRRATP